MRKPQDVRLLVQAYLEMAADEDDPEHVGRWRHAVALLTWVLEEPERACACDDPQCDMIDAMREQHAEYDEWLAEDRGAMN